MMLKYSLASTAAGDGLDVGTAGILDGLQGADRGFVVEAVDSVDLGIGGQDVRHVLQAVLTGEGGGVLDDLHVGSDFSHGIGEALHAQLGHGAGGRHGQGHDGAGGADLLDDVVGAGNAHALVIAGHLVDALGGNVHIEATTVMP